MTALSFVWVYPYSQNSRCDISTTHCLSIISCSMDTLSSNFSSFILSVSHVEVATTVSFTRCGLLEVFFL